MSIASGSPKSTARLSAWIGRYGRNSRCELARRSTHSEKMPCTGVQRYRPRSHAPTRKINANTGQALGKLQPGSWRSQLTVAADAGYRVELVGAGCACARTESLLTPRMLSLLAQ